MKAVTEELCGHEFSSSSISRIVAKLDEELERFAARRLEDEYPYLGEAGVIAVGHCSAGQRTGPQRRPLALHPIPAYEDRGPKTILQNMTRTTAFRRWSCSERPVPTRAAERSRKNPWTEGAGRAPPAMSRFPARKKSAPEA